MSGLNQYPSSLAPTPLVAIRLSPESPSIYCKLEFLNPSGSTKDRIARYILEKALHDGRLKSGGTVIEASSGSTSIAMALTCAQLGLRFIAVMPEGVSNERVLMIRAYGGAIHFTPRADGVREAIRQSERLAFNTHAFLPRQFANPENASAHEFGTAREILSQLSNGIVDAVVSGVGTGGTLVGLYRGFRGSGDALRPVLARPVNLTRSREEECCSFSCCIPGVVDSISTIFRAADFPNLITVEVDDREAIQVTRQLIAMGFPVGPSSGLNYRAAAIAAEQLNRDATIVTVFPDRMERYFTTDLFQPFLLEV
ncbi:MAG: cysteine synthase family protein [Acidobacteriota bacterium]|nr:cysteine synthase family protein [Acidobacteriota bacterium]